MRGFIKRIVIPPVSPPEAEGELEPNIEVEPVWAEEVQGR